MAVEVKAGTINVKEIHEDDLAILARYGDADAKSELWERSVALSRKIANTFASRYPWIDRDDLAQTVLAEFPKFLRRYKPHLAKGWERYLYHCIYRATQDALRAEDPVGLNYPHKRHYPSWRRFSELFPSDVLEDEINNGLSRIDRGHAMNLSPDLPAAQPKPRHVRAEWLYHGRRMD